MGGSKIENIIVELLASHQEITLDSVGSFIFIRKAAKLDAATKKLLPPTFEMEFSTKEGDDSIINHLCSELKTDVESATEQYYSWLNSLKVRENGVVTYTIPSVGVISSSKNETSFICDKELSELISPLQNVDIPTKIELTPAPEIIEDEKANEEVVIAPLVSKLQKEEEVKEEISETKVEVETEEPTKPEEQPEVTEKEVITLEPQPTQEEEEEEISEEEQENIEEEEDTEEEEVSEQQQDDEESDERLVPVVWKQVAIIFLILYIIAAIAAVYIYSNKPKEIVKEILIEREAPAIDKGYIATDIDTLESDSTLLSVEKSDSATLQEEVEQSKPIQSDNKEVENIVFDTNRYYLVAGVFKSENGVKKVMQRLKNQGIESAKYAIYKPFSKYVIYIDNFSSEKEARAKLNELAAQNSNNGLESNYWILKPKE